MVQVININLLYPNPFPADQTVAIINQTAQLIHVADKLPVTPNEVGSYTSIATTSTVVMCLGAHICALQQILVAHMHTRPCICVKFNCL